MPTVIPMEWLPLVPIELSLTIISNHYCLPLVIICNHLSLLSLWNFTAQDFFQAEPPSSKGEDLVELWRQIYDDEVGTTPQQGGWWVGGEGWWTGWWNSVNWLLSWWTGSLELMRLRSGDFGLVLWWNLKWFRVGDSCLFVCLFYTIDLWHHVACRSSTFHFLLPRSTNTGGPLAPGPCQVKNTVVETSQGPSDDATNAVFPYQKLQADGARQGMIRAIMICCHHSPWWLNDG